MTPTQTTGTLTCPRCGVSSRAEMPAEACLFFWTCPHCGALLRPRPGDCCVFCSYGDVSCPPVQRERPRQEESPPPAPT
ncbi:MAG: GDCCVxC domain-containing (seleno)protein [Candidatus Latescibacterota bacterium]